MPNIGSNADPTLRRQPCIGTSPRGDTSPLVSVVIPNCNGKGYLENCIPSIAAQTYSKLELVLVDNGSSDGSVQFTRANFADAKIVCNPRNLGFAKAINQGVRSSIGHYVFILNNDTVLERDCVEILVRVMEECKQRRGGKVIGLAPKTLLSDRPIIDSVGNAINPDGAAFNVGIGQVDLGQFDEPMRVMGLCFAAAFIERAAFDLLGSLDESYFAYYEDVDWCYRANVLGCEFYSAPRALVHHHHSGSVRTLITRDRKYYLIHRNLMRTMIKNYFRGNLVRAARRLLIYAFSAYENLRALKFQKAWLQLKIVGVTFLWLPMLLAKNARVNRRRVLSDHEIWGIASQRLIQISGSTFNPETYSPVVTLDVMEEILQHLALVLWRKEYLPRLLGVHAINYLVKQGHLKIDIRFGIEPATSTPSQAGLRIKGVLGYKIGGMTFISHKRHSYVVDQFLMNLVLFMKDRTIEEVAEALLDSVSSDYIGSKLRSPGTRDSEMMSELARLHDPLSYDAQRLVLLAGIRSIVSYLEKLDLIESATIKRLAA